MTTNPDTIRQAHARANIRRTANRHGIAKTERDNAILAGRQVGLTVREIAELADVSRQTVLNIVTRATEGGD